MRHFLPLVLCLAVQICGSSAASEDAEAISRLDKALQAAARFEPGQDSGPLVEIERVVFHLPPGSELRNSLEGKLIAALEVAGTREAKGFFCRQLRVIGTVQSVPHLEKLLTDPDVSHMARYALGRMEGVEASAALQRALARTSGKLQAGIVDTLADRRCQEAQPEIVKLLNSPDRDVARASVRALGRLGGAEAAGALRLARGNAPTELQADIDHALLNCAALLAAEGQPAAAAAIYQAIYAPGVAEAMRFAGLRGLVETRGEAALGLLVEALRGNDSDLARFAISLTSKVTGESATRDFVAALASLVAENRVLMIRALAVRGDRAAGPAMIAQLSSPDEPVRVAALDALGYVGDDSAVAPLLEIAATAAGASQGVARASLLRLPGEDIDRQLLQLLGSGPDAMRGEVARALAGRRVAAAVLPLLTAAENESGAVRREALQALGVLAGEAELPALVALAAKSRSPEDQTAGVDAIAKVFARIDDKARCAGPVLTQWGQADDDAKPILLQLLGKTGSPRALPILRVAVKQPNAAVRSAAIAALAQWPDATVADDLLAIVAGVEEPAQKQLALQGYVRLAAAAPNPTSMLEEVLKRVERVNDKKLVLESLGQTSDSPAALALAASYLNDRQLQAAAGLAALRISNRLRDRDPQLARGTLRRVIAAVENADVRQRAQEVLNDLDKYEGHILDWTGTGPFVEKGKDGAAIYQTVFPPEDPGAQGVNWQPVTKGIGSWEINLEATFGGMDYCAAYLRTRVWSPVAQEGQLEMGSDDGVKAWWNGTVVFDQWGEGSVAPRQKRVKVALRQGWNDLMLKIVDQQGGWMSACRLRAPDGTALEGIKVQAN